MKYQIKHLGVGGIFDQVFKLLRDQAGLLFGIVGTTLLPLQLLQGFLSIGVEQGDPLGPAVLIVILIALVSIPISLLVNAAVIHAVASAYLSRETTIGACFRHALGRCLPLLGTSILYGLAVMGGSFLCLIPGIIAALWFFLAPDISVLEGIAGVDAMKRSRTLMKGNMLTLFILGLILYAIIIPVIFGLMVVPEPHVKAVILALWQSVVTLIATAMGVVFYFSCRCKVENFDLQMLADAVGVEKPSVAVDGFDVIEP